MKRCLPTFLLVAVPAILLCSLLASAQGTDVKFVADTLVVQAEGTYETDPDLATLTFDISAQEKELKQAYEKASQSMRKIVSVAEKNGLSAAEIQMGVLTITPYFEGDRRKRARSYLVQGQIILKVRDFSKLGSILDDSVQEGIADFRSLTYSLADEEAAKQKAVGEAMRRAVGRARAALEQNHQKLGQARYVNLEVKHLVTAAQVGSYGTAETVLVESSVASRSHAPPPPLPMPQVRPEKIAISATVQCVFQIQ